MVNFRLVTTVASTVASLRGEDRVVLVRFLVAAHCRESRVRQLYAKAL